MTLKKQYPYDQGWLHMKLVLTSDKPLSQDELKRVATLGKADEYEIPHIVQHGRRVTAITRHQDRKPAAA